MASYAATTASDKNPFSTVPGQLVSSGLDILTELGNKYKDNATIGGLVAGSIGDIGKTQANTGLALMYNDAFLGSLGSYQQALENTKKGNAMELMAAEGRIAKDMQADKLATDRYGADRDVDKTRLVADANRYAADQELAGVRVKSDADRYGYDQQLAGTKVKAEAERYGYDQQLAGTKVKAEAERYGYDKQFEGTKYQSDSQERQIGLKGSEERKTLMEQTNQTLNLRRDARGAIATAGRRFYG